MGPSSTIIATVTGEPAVGLVPSLLLAALGLAIVVVIVVKLARESDDEAVDSDGESSVDDPSPEESAPDSETGTEHDGGDVVQ